MSWPSAAMAVVALMVAPEKEKTVVTEVTDTVEVRLRLFKLSKPLSSWLGAPST